MRKFKCYECGHTWELPFGEGGRGIDQTCPQCGGKNVHRALLPGGLGWWRGRGRVVGDTDDLPGPGWYRGWGRGRRAGAIDDLPGPGWRRGWGRGRRGRV